MHYQTEFNNGEAFERYVFGSSPLRREEELNLLNENITLTVALRHIISQSNGMKHPDTEVGKDLYYFVKRFLSDSLKLNVKKLGFYSTVRTRADRLGADGIFYLIVARDTTEKETAEIEMIAIIDAFLILPDFAAKIYKKDLTFDLQQDIVYKAKRILHDLRSEDPNRHVSWHEFWRRYHCAEDSRRLRRCKNKFILTPYDIRKPKGLKEFGKEISLSFWKQLNPGIRTPF